MNVIEHLVRSFAKRTTQNGAVVLITDGQPALVDAFKELGWSDPYPDPLLLPPKPIAEKVVITTSGFVAGATTELKPKGDK